MYSVSEKILNILKNYYYFVKEDKTQIKKVLPEPQSFSVVSNQLVMQFTANDYDNLKFISSLDNFFNIRNIHLKNNIVSFSKDAMLDKFYNVEFANPINKKKDDILEFYNFNPISFNGLYKIVFISEDKKSAKLYKEIINNDIVLTNGYTSLEYFSGINKSTQLVFDDTNKTANYTFDINSIYSPKQTSDLDLTKKPKIYQSSVMLMNYKTFLANNKVNSEYLIIDSSSFTIQTAKNPQNQTDSIVNLINNATIQYDIYSGAIYYVINRKVEDSLNKTQSGGDIEAKQTEMLNNLRGLLLHIEDNTKCYITSSSIDDEIIEGSFVVQYLIEFTKPVSISNIYVNFINDAYPIKQLQLNNDTINLANYID
jgi:hypothetical protein